MRDTNHPVCLDERRKSAIRDHPALNGIDYVEYFEDRSAPVGSRYWLAINFLKEVPTKLVGNKGAIVIEGGVRIIGVKITDVKAGANAQQLFVFFDQPGDFSTYTVRVAHENLDSQLSAATFSFKAGCSSPFDCQQERECPPKPLEEPKLDYLAKDYASFRRLLLDFAATRNPNWLERNPADLGVALVELLAYAGDHLSYLQDAVATEAYLDTCRHRISARRHARLIDYVVHEGRNAWTYIQLDVSAAGDVPQGTKLITRITRPPLHQSAAPPVLIPSTLSLDFDSDPALAGAEVFETSARITADPKNNKLYIHAFGDRDCCLPKGTRGVFLYGLPDAPGVQQALPPALEAGDYLLLEEVKSPVNGAPPDANSRHRQVVRLAEVQTKDRNGNPLTDPVFRNLLADGKLEAVTDATTQSALPLVQVSWSEADALAFPLCLSAEHSETGPVDHISVARGNVVPCDHGRTVIEEHKSVRRGDQLLFARVDPSTDEQSVLVESAAGRTNIGTIKLAQAPLTFQPMPESTSYDQADRLREPRHQLDAPARSCMPAVVLIMEFPLAETEIWQPVPHLMESRAFDRHFVAEIDSDGAPRLRFGDDEYGRRPFQIEKISARYRVGNGRAGNLGSGALYHIFEPAAAEMIDPANPSAPSGLFPVVDRVWQPLPAVGGVDPEGIEEVRQLAPRAFRAEQFRAVTETDYEQAALKLGRVAAAKCAFRWTGSWHTVFVALHPRNSADLITDPSGRTRLSDGLAREAHSHLTRYKLAGYDLALRTAQYVPLEIAIEICVAPGHFRGDVLREAYRALSNRRNRNGSLGFFHPQRFCFGEDVYLSQIYAAFMAIEGINSAILTTFERYWETANQELENGVIIMGDWEIPRLDNDPNFAENGVLTITARGGL